MKRLPLNRLWRGRAMLAGTALWFSMPLAVKAAPESSISIVSLTAHPAFPGVGRAVTWTAVASGGSGSSSSSPLQYKSSVWTTGRGRP